MNNNNAFIFNRKTDGRFVVAQTIEMLQNQNALRNAHNLDIDQRKYAINNFTFKYAMETLYDEVNRMVEMENEADPALNVYRTFLPIKDILVIINDLQHELALSIQRESVRKGVKDRPHCGTKTFTRMERLSTNSIEPRVRKEKSNHKLVYWHRHFRNRLHKIKRESIIANVTSYKQLYKLMTGPASECNIQYSFKKLDKLDHFKVPDSWQNYYKVKGTFLVTMNLIKFHDMSIVDDNGCEIKGVDAVDQVNNDIMLLTIKKFDEKYFKYIRAYLYSDLLSADTEEV